MTSWIHCFLPKPSKRVVKLTGKFLNATKYCNLFRLPGVEPCRSLTNPKMTDELKVSLFIFRFFYFDFVLSFVFFLNGHNVFDVINVFCCCLILLFVLTSFLNIGISHQSNASFFSQLSYLLWRLSFRSYTNFFFEKYLNFCCFLSVPHLVDNYAKIVVERGRNLMCDCTLPSVLVLHITVKTFDNLICLL